MSFIFAGDLADELDRREHDLVEHMDVDELRNRVRNAIAMCRRHNHPGVNTGAQTLAVAVLKSLGAEEYAER